MTLGEKIKQLRSEKQLTQKELAQALQVSNQAVSNWEKGKNFPDIQIIVQLAELFDVSLDVLLKDDQAVIERLAHDTLVNKQQKKKILLLTA